jgi:hypothetical protein
MSMSFEAAIALLRSRSSTDVSGWVIGRLMGQDVQPFGNSRESEDPADVISDLLRHLQPSPQRTTLLEALDFHGASFLPDLMRSAPIPKDRRNALVRLLSVLDSARPQEMKSLARVAFAAASVNSHLDPVIKQLAARAVLALGVSSDQFDLWHSVLGTPSLSAYAVRALIQIDPKSSKVIDALAGLIRQRLDNDEASVAISLIWLASAEAGDSRSFLLRNLARTLFRDDPQTYDRLQAHLVNDTLGLQLLPQMQQAEMAELGDWPTFFNAANAEASYVIPLLKVDFSSDTVTKNRRNAEIRFGINPYGTWAALMVYVDVSKRDRDIERLREIANEFTHQHDYQSEFNHDERNLAG